MLIYKNFIAIDGPNGVGKSSVINSIVQLLKSQGRNVQMTKEPTKSQLGDFIRANQNKYHAHTLALLVAADRYDHNSKLIRSYLEKGQIVITDRYFASSLVYQIQDGLSYNFIDAINSEIILPSLYFILTASADTLQSRLQERNQLTRFESKNFATKEIELFLEAGKRLSSNGVKVVYIDNDSNGLDIIIERIMKEIIGYLDV